MRSREQKKSCVFRSIQVQSFNAFLDQEFQPQSREVLSPIAYNKNGQSRNDSKHTLAERESSKLRLPDMRSVASPSSNHFSSIKTRSKMTREAAISSALPRNNLRSSMQQPFVESGSRDLFSPDFERSDAWVVKKKKAYKFSDAPKASTVRKKHTESFLSTKFLQMKTHLASKTIEARSPRSPKSPRETLASRERSQRKQNNLVNIFKNQKFILPKIHFEAEASVHPSGVNTTVEGCSSRVGHLNTSAYKGISMAHTKYLQNKYSEMSSKVVSRLHTKVKTESLNTETSFSSLGHEVAPLIPVTVSKTKHSKFSKLSPQKTLRTEILNTHIQSHERRVYNMSLSEQESNAFHESNLEKLVHKLKNPKEDAGALNEYILHSRRIKEEIDHLEDGGEPDWPGQIYIKFQEDQKQATTANQATKLLSPAVELDQDLFGLQPRKTGPRITVEEPSRSGMKFHTAKDTPKRKSEHYPNPSTGLAMGRKEFQLDLQPTKDGESSRYADKVGGEEVIGSEGLSQRKSQLPNSHRPSRKQSKVFSGGSPAFIKDSFTSLGPALIHEMDQMKTPPRRTTVDHQDFQQARISTIKPPSRNKNGHEKLKTEESALSSRRGESLAAPPSKKNLSTTKGDRSTSSQVFSRGDKGKSSKMDLSSAAGASEEEMEYVFFDERKFEKDLKSLLKKKSKKFDPVKDRVALRKSQRVKQIEDLLKQFNFGEVKLF